MQPTERGPEWERLRHRVSGINLRDSAIWIAAISLSREFSCGTSSAIEMEAKMIDAATDYLWSLGVRG